jgi:hypothetical protein
MVGIEGVEFGEGKVVNYTSDSANRSSRPNLDSCTELGRRGTFRRINQELYSAKRRKHQPFYALANHTIIRKIDS